MYGLGLVWAACGMVLRFGARYYQAHKSEYTANEQANIEALLDVAEEVQAAIASRFIPLP